MLLFFFDAFTTLPCTTLCINECKNKKIKKKILSGWKISITSKQKKKEKKWSLEHKNGKQQKPFFENFKNIEEQKKTKTEWFQNDDILHKNFIKVSNKKQTKKQRHHYINRTQFKCAPQVAENSTTGLNFAPQANSGNLI